MRFENWVRFPPWLNRAWPSRRLPRLLAEVIEPLSRGDRGRYQRDDWSTDTLAEWCTVERDGPSAVDQWESWMAAEDAHFARDPVRERADVIVDGRRQQDRDRLPYVDPLLAPNDVAISLIAWR